MFPDLWVLLIHVFGEGAHENNDGLSDGVCLVCVGCRLHAALTV